MAYCTNCGKELPGNADFCTNCGASCKDGARNNQQSNPYSCGGQNHPNTSYVPPMYNDAPPPKESRYSVTSTWEYLLYFFLASVPVVGLIVFILWACGASEKQNRIHFARGYLIYIAITLVISVLFVVFFSVVFISIFTEEIISEFDSYYDILFYNECSQKSSSNNLNDFFTNGRLFLPQNSVSSGFCHI